jgi:hypothetical protein
LREQSTAVDTKYKKLEFREEEEEKKWGKFGGKIKRNEV